MWDAVIDAGRRVYESQMMIDTVAIHGPASGGTFDESTGKLTGGTGALIYSGKCRRVPGKRFEQQVASGGRVDVQTRAQLHLPMSAPHIVGGSVVTLLAAPKDPSSVGQTLYVNGPA
jgi:hypothetical protein